MTSRADIVDAIVANLRRAGISIPGRRWRRAMLEMMDAPVGTSCSATPTLSAASFDERVAAASGIYRTDRLRYVDVDGDAELIRFHDRGLELVLSVLVRVVADAAAGRRPQSPGPSPFPPGWAQRISAEFLVEIDRIGLRPFIGPEHVWSAEAIDYLRRHPFGQLGSALSFEGPTLPVCGISKLLLMLMWGLTPRFAPTGSEHALIAWMMTAPDRSLAPRDVFREACRRARGDLYLALLTATNVLADRHWRSDRQAQPIQSKLQYLRDDEIRSGDNFSAWYHLFGAATYGLMRPRWLSRTAAISEAALAVLFRGLDPQAMWPNLIGAELGHRLREAIQDKAPILRIG